MACTAANGLSVKPNYVAVDWAHVGDAADVVDYLNFGGRLGTGQRCDSGLDCATGACSEDMHQCHCQQCDSAATHECSGCDAEESCISTGEKGVHACIPNKSDIFHIDQYNAAQSTSFPQSKILMLLIASVFSQSI